MGVEQGLKVVGFPSVERRRRAIAAAAHRLTPRRDEIAGHVVRACREQIPAYAAIEDAKILGDLTQTAATHVDALLRALSDEPVRAEAFRELIRVGERRARQGIPMRHLLHAYQLGTRVVLDYVLDELRLDLDLRARLDYERLVGRVVHTIFDLSTRTSAAIADLYSITDRRPGAVAPEVLLAQILDADASLEDATLAASRLGMPLESWYLTFVVAGDQTLSDGARARIFEAVNAVTRSRGKPAMRATPLDGTIAFVVSIESPTVAGRLAATLGPVLTNAGTHPLNAYFGRPSRGVAGIRESHEQALATQALFESLGARAPLVTYEQALPLLLLRGDPARAADVLGATVGPLIAHDRSRRQDPLVPVLKAFLDMGGKRHLMAKALHLSTRTVDRRLARIESLTGRSLTDSNDLLLLGLGLAAMELTDR